ncbi:hypothetical protein Ssi03_25270 [Sphaerisporangium siamense]|uniref:ABC-type transport system involved in multi-copper enzyme maturation permease subunit n=1 Tax=Sphaerisporangium siamense TaxID=795645 RepID=A0A7W7G926_9ACTN|nr:ABC transporter permease [Sphaerisporangium siamense]MBB4700149.1 ABC-type transport system involved in multi-copper enzyme maturation permease subunit [Sphaerisporangium siamense]GII84537.1 hypothetical protein Ssi03_25270 [Sphaerisporangium siamense]
MTAVPTPATRTRGREAAQALAAELSKLMSLPAAWHTLAGTLVVNLLLSAALATAGRGGSTGARGALDVGLASVGYAQAGFVVLGVLAACSEYTGGQIRTTLTAMPRRTLQLTAKHLALAIVVLPAAAATVTSGVVTAGVLGGTAAPVSPGHLARALIGVTAYLTLTTLLSAAVGALVRRTLAAVVMLQAYYFIVGPLLRDRTQAARYLPDTAGLAMGFPVSGGTGAVTPAHGALVLTAWTIVLIALAMLTYRRWDA